MQLAGTPQIIYSWLANACPSLRHLQYLELELRPFEDMGTRGLLGVILRSGRRKASYNHWDSYPAGLGKEIAKFTKSLSDAQVDEMAEKYEEITW